MMGGEDCDLTVELLIEDCLSDLWLKMIEYFIHIPFFFGIFPVNNNNESVILLVVDNC